MGRSVGIVQGFPSFIPASNSHANEKWSHSLDNAKNKASIDSTNNAYEWQLEVNAHLEQTVEEFKKQAPVPNPPKP